MRYFSVARWASGPRQQAHFSVWMDTVWSYSAWCYCWFQYRVNNHNNHALAECSLFEYLAVCESVSVGITESVSIPEGNICSPKHPDPQASHLSIGPWFWARGQALVFSRAGFLFGSPGWLSWTISRMRAFTQEEALPGWGRLFHRCPISCLVTRNNINLTVRSLHLTPLRRLFSQVWMENWTRKTRLLWCRQSAERNGTWYQCQPLEWKTTSLYGS